MMWTIELTLMRQSWHKKKRSIKTDIFGTVEVSIFSYYGKYCPAVQQCLGLSININKVLYIYTDPTTYVH